MKSAPSETAESLNSMRQKLILAQVRIMELEDKRDELGSQKSQLERTLVEMQSIAQERIGERDHLATITSELQNQLSQLQRQLAASQASLEQHQRNVAELETALKNSEHASSKCQIQLTALDDQLKAIKASRSWRWTAPLRSLERLLRRNPCE